MKKVLRTLLFAAMPIAASAQVTVSTSLYTTDQLVNNVLLSNSCYPVTNVTSKTGTDFASVNGIGYFQSNNSDFPFENGIILSSGDALNANGPITEIVSGGSQQWLGDSDIDFFTNNGGTTITKNASVLEFDFIPLKEEISLDYIFASNDYGLFQCSWGDAVVFLLKDITEAGAYSNIGVIPGTTTPVCVGTIRSNANNSYCTSLNEQFFGSYYASAPATAPINFKGATVVMTAQAAVIPGHTYHLKIAIADKQDIENDCAVFINAGSLNIGAFSDFELVAEGQNICSSEGVTLHANLGITNPDAEFTFEWSMNGMAVSGETQSSFSPTIAGLYSVIATHSLTGCSEMRSITVEPGTGLPIELTFTDLVVADDNNDGIATFDLSINTTEIDNQTGQPEIYSVSYHVTMEDAEYGVNAIANPSAYTNIINAQQTLYALVFKGDSNCYDVFSFNLIVGTIPEAPTGETDQTFSEGDTLADLEVEGENILWYDNSGETPDFPDGTSLPLPLTTALVNGTTYYASQTVNGIESTDRFPVTVQVTAGLEDTVFNGLSYYPNPVNNILNIENANGIDTVLIANALGQKVFTKTINSNTAQLDVSSLSNGIYFATIRSGSAVKTLKIIKE